MPKLVETLTVLFAATTLAHGQGTATELGYLRAGDPGNFDSFGSAVAVSGETVLIGAWSDWYMGLNDAGSAYVFERDQGGPGAWGQAIKLIASDGAKSDYFGVKVALCGDTAVAGATDDDHASGVDGHPFGQGSAYVFERNQGGPEAWGEVVKLIASDAAPGDNFGQGVGVSGDTIVVGALWSGPGGAAYVFERDAGGPGAWGQVAKLTVPGSGNFGSAAAIDGDTIAVGAEAQDGGAGSAYVFERNLGGPGAWGVAAELVRAGAGPGDWFGDSISISLDTVVVGAPNTDTYTGAAYVFERDQGGAGAWGEVAELTAGGAMPGDAFGGSVAVSGDRILSGAAQESNQSGTEAGAAFVFERDQGGPGAWGQTLKLKGSQETTSDYFGLVALSADLAVVGAPGDDHSGKNAPGSAYVFGFSVFESYCSAGTSASGCAASLFATGTASATAGSGFDLAASSVEGQKDGLFFFGTSGRQAAPWGNGTSYQCVVPPVTRAGLLTGSGTAGLCDGFLGEDLNALWCPTCPKPQKNPGAGAVVQAQLWYRDPASTGNQTTSLSGAVEFTVNP